MSSQPGPTAPLRVRPLPLADPDVAVTWRRLQAAGGVGSPFLAWELLSALADVPELSAGMQVLVAVAGHQPLGLLPLESRRGPAGLRTLGLVPSWLGADHLDVVAEPRHRQAVAAAVAGHLAARAGWQLLDLEGLDRSGALAGQVRRRLRPPRFLPLPAIDIPVPYVALDDATAPSRRNASKEAARKLRGFERGGGGLSVADAPEQVAGLLEELMELHNRRMGAVSSVFATPAHRRFHLLAARRMAGAGLARIYRLAAGEVNAGLQYDFVLGDRVYFYQSGIEPSAGRSPGLVVLGGAIRSAAEEGFAEFDLLRGDEAYKLRFATGVRRDLRLLVVRLTAPAVVRGGAWAAGRSVRQLAGRAPRGRARVGSDPRNDVRHRAAADGDGPA